MSKAGTIGVPGTKTMKSAFMDFAVGAGGGLVYGLLYAMLGSGLIGALAAPVIAGSMVKGERGTALATVAGFLALKDVFTGSSGGTATASASTGDNGVM